MTNARSKRRNGPGKNSRLARSGFLYRSWRDRPMRRFSRRLSRPVRKDKSGMPTKSANHSNTGIPANRVFTKNLGRTVSTDTVLISSYKSGMASRVLLENNHKRPELPRSTRSTDISTLPLSLLIFVHADHSSSACLNPFGLILHWKQAPASGSSCIGKD